MPTLAELKASSPAYAQMSDDEFAQRVYDKHYKGKMPYAEFVKRTGYDSKNRSLNSGMTREQRQAQIAALDAQKPTDPLEGFQTTLQVATPFGTLDTGVELPGWLSRGLAGAGKSFVDTGKGIKQRATSVAGGVADVVGADEAAAGFRQSLAQQHAEQAERERIDAALMSDPAGITGNIVGTLAQVLGPGGVLKLASRVPQAGSAASALNAASRTFLPTTVKGATAQGSALGLLQPVADEAQIITNGLLGGAGGLLGAGVPRLVGGAMRGARGLLSPIARADEAAVRNIMDEASNPATLLTPAPSKVPGVNRTLFDESLDPGVARLETKARGMPGQSWVDLDRRNNLARVDAIRRFAGDDAAISAAKEARARAVAPLYAEARRQGGVDTSRLLSQVRRAITMNEGKPAVQQGLAKIENLLAREVPEAEIKRNALAPLQAFADSGRKSAADFDSAKQAMTAIRRGEMPTGTFQSKAGQDALKEARKAMKRTVVGQDKVRTLSNIRDEIGYMLSGKYGGESGAALAGSRELMAVRNQLDRVLDKYAPEYDQARRAFIDQSRPINRMEVGQGLLSRAAVNIDDPVTGAPVLTPDKFGRQAKNLDGVARAATGFRKARAASLLEPEDFQTIGAIQDDLNRSAQRLKYGSGGGSHTDAQQMLGKRLAAGGLAKMKWVGAIVESLHAAGERRVAEAMGQILQNPQQYREIAARLSTRDRRLLEQAMVRIGGAAGANALPATK